MEPKKFQPLNAGVISVRDQSKLEPELCRRKYQVHVELLSGKLRYLYLDDFHIAELYVKIIGAKILLVKKL